MPSVEEVNGENAAGAEGPTGTGGQPPPQGSAIQRVMAHMMSNKVEAALWATRVLTVFFTISFFLPIFGGSPHSAYQKALLSNAATSALRLHQRLPNFQLSREFLGTLFLEDSAHYLFFSIIFLYSNPVTMVLIPAFLFALLHATTYTKQVLDKVSPTFLQLVRNLIDKLKTHQVSVLRFIAMNEIFLMPATVFMIFAGQGSLLLPFIYYRFLTLRYASRRNPYCRTLFYELRVTAEFYAGHQSCPAMLRNLVFKAIGIISRLAPVVAAA